MIGTTPTEVQEYLDAVKRHLADLPPDELDDLTIDLEAHVTEVHGEGEGGLVARLGTPAAYAAELRASAGLGRLPAGTERMARLRADGRRGLAAVSRWWAGFRPVWIAVRGWLAVTLWVLVNDSATVFQPFPIPHFGSALVGLGMVVLATLASYAIAERAPERSGWRRTDMALTATVLAALAFTLVAGDALRGRFVADPVAFDEDAYRLATATNLYPYDLDGNPLAGVLLFDQDGRPVDLHPHFGASNPEVEFRTDRFGQPIKNAFPLDLRLPVTNERGDLVYEPRPAPRVPLPDVTD